MRLYRKKQCMDMLAVLGEAWREAAGLIERRQTAAAAALLEQCQQGAIALGTAIENAGAEKTGTREAGVWEAVHWLEEYCECLYRLHEALAQGISIDRKKQYIDREKQQLLRLLDKTGNILKNKISTRREAVFLPYKASMWDSLESVWRAAEEDPDCSAYVIPIPYFEKNPDGSFGRMCYEADRFPPEVPVAGYDTYDFEKRHPDLIFIHNPYDDGNYVTSVHPFFYSENLRQYTDKLVYIPYFILGETDPSDREAVERMSHFCTTAGVLNADYVIVQSEAMRQIYVDVLTGCTGEGKRPYWEGKILGLGSPKVDKVCSLRKEDFDMPEEWERVIRRADGSRKKVILYNTSVSALLKKEEAMLGKMRENFRIFQENAGDTALLWRPHPLSEATLSSMRPGLLGDYEKMVREYREAGWGIYDDSPNLDRAIAVSDAYYGDMSSLVWLYQKTGKPIMIQNVEVEECSLN